MPRQKTLSPEQEQQAVTDYNDGAKTADIAAQCGVSQPTISKTLRRFGVVFRPPQLSEQGRKRISQASKARFKAGIKPTMQGRKHSPKTIRQMRQAQRGATNPHWNGGQRRVKGSKGQFYIYLRVPTHPSVQGKSSPYIAEHRLVMEKKLGRYLDDSENVHHINGIKDDNRPENLELVAHTNHFGEVRCPHCLNHFLVK